MKTLVIGCDIAKKTFEAAIQNDDDGPKNLGELNNNAHGYKELRKAIKHYVNSAGRIHLVVEPTGTYHLGLIGYAYEQGWDVSIPNPLIVRRWAMGQGLRAKNDKIDARTLAKYGYKEEPSTQLPLPEHVLSLELMLTREENLEKMLQQEHNRLEGFNQRPGSCESVRNSLLQSIEHLDEGLTMIRQDIKTHLKEYPDLAQQRTLLLTVCGVGEKSVLKLLVFLHRWDARTSSLGTAKGLVAFAGLDPVISTSGTSVYRHPSISKMGDSEIRRTLFMAARGGIRAKDSPLLHFFNGLIARGKATKLALVAGARKILVWAFAVFRSGQIFDYDKAMPKSV